MHVVSPLVTTVVDDMRHCRRDDNDNHDNSDGGGDFKNDVIKTRKKMRFPDPPPVSPASIGGGDSGENEVVPKDVSCPPRQWWFSRHSLTTPLAGVTSNADTDDSDVNIKVPSEQREKAEKNVVSGMVLSEHLGRASDVVESLTHDVKNWSLTRLSTTPSTTRTTPNATKNSSDQKKEKHKRCKDAQRQVRVARRRCLEEQKRMLHSSTNPTTAMDCMEPTID